MKQWYLMLKVSGAVALLYSIAAAIFLFAQWYDFNRNIDAYIDRAQVAADREDMVGYVEQLKQNMEHMGLTKGHFVLIFTTPANDLALHYRTVTRILERLHSIDGIPKNDTAYQVALDDIRGTIRELENPAKSLTWTKFWFLYIGFSIWLWPLVILLRA